MDGDKIRLFIALNIPDELRKYLKGFQSRLKHCPGRISWVRPDNVHITLKFLGDTEKERINSLVEALSELSSAIMAFRLRSNGLGAFPSRKSPRNLWLGIDESVELAALKEGLEEALSQAGFEKDNKPFRPHLTLCRLRSKEASKAMGSMALDIKAEKKVAFDVDRFVLYKSILGPHGASYDIIREFPLGKKEA